MPTFALRTAAGASALRTTTADYLRPRYLSPGSWHILFEGVEDVSYVDAATIRVTDSGPGAPSTLIATHFDPARAVTIPARAFVEVADTSGYLVWTGRVIGRRKKPISPSGFIMEIDASDLLPDLDASYIDSDSTPAGWDDRMVVQYLVNRYAYTGIRAPDLSVDVTNGSMPALTFTATTLAAALTQVADAAGTDRSWSVNYMNLIAYHRVAPFQAPYAISDAPNGTTSVAAEELTYESDEADIINAVWVTGPTDADTGLPVASGWVTDTASITAYGRREATLNNDDATDSSKVTLYGSAYLAKVSEPTIRGSFRVTGKDGWRSGQVVTITSTALGLSAEPFEIREVEWQFASPLGTRTYQCNFGALPRSLVRLLKSGESGDTPILW